MKLRYSALLLALVSCGALAQEADTSTLEQALTEQDGMTLVSEGFYAKLSAGNESYVATNAAGERTLLAKLLELRHGSRAKLLGTGEFDGLIASLSTVAPKGGSQTENASQYGSCAGPAGTGQTGPFYVQALAGGGLGGSAYGASAQATNSTSPLVASSNTASATVVDANGNIVAQQTTTTAGATAAYASAYATSRGCTSSSYATITCSGHTSPSVTAVTYNQRTYPHICIPN